MLLNILLVALYPCNLFCNVQTDLSLFSFINLLTEARKRDKGVGMLMALGLMLSKTMAIMSLGGVGVLAMKALGIAMTALMMAGMVGLKTMTNRSSESTHSVQYVTADGHHHIRRRRRRSTGNKNSFAHAHYSSHT